MPDGVHAAVDAVQTTGGDTLANSVRGEPELVELPERNEAVLAEREGRNRDVARGVLRFTRLTGRFPA
jgi:hypothetical protein